MNFISDEDIERVLDFLRTAAVQCAKAKAERIYLDEYKHSLRALIMKEHPEISVAAQEREAYADMRYIQHLQALQVAVENDCRMQFLRAAAEAKLSAWQTMHATERAMKI